MEKEKLRLIHIPQLGARAEIIIEVESLEEALRVSEILAYYDLMQYEKKIKSDYTNMTLLEMYKDGEWTTYYNECFEDFDDIKCYDKEYELKEKWHLKLKGKTQEEEKIEEKENFESEDFDHVEAELILQMCEDCGRSYEILDEEEELEECPECEGYLVNETNFEGMSCHLCGKEFEIWEDAFVHGKNSNIIICEDCYEELE